MTAKGLLTPRGYGLFLSENYGMKEILNFFFCQYLLFWVILKNPQPDFQIFTFSECKDDLTSLFTSQPIAVVALSTASVCRPRAPSAGAPTLCPPAPCPLAPQKVPLACQAASRLEPGQVCQLLGLALRYHWVAGHHPGQLVVGAQQHLMAELSIVSLQIQYYGSCGELCWGWESPCSHSVSGPLHSKWLEMALKGSKWLSMALNNFILEKRKKNRSGSPVDCRPFPMKFKNYGKSTPLVKWP